ncbi:hypothetical protein [Chitinophaga sp. HK235]|uniref:hypothetical protein n=1 Tax=Chitinophaga sp. HK235 TaxID=2952571 RepID=UPI001BA999AA|nr:hypothetical protein [Chitinophaga sp. HK235]
MKKMMIYLLATGIGVFTVVPFQTSLAAHRHRTKEEKREARAERKEARAEKRMAKKTGMPMEMPTTTTTNYNTMWYPQAALPVMEDFIPSNIVSNLKNTYGSNLYDITSMKCRDGSDCYTVRVIQNGVVQTIVVNADGNTVAQ